MKTFFKVLLGLAAIPLAWIVYAYVLATLWDWFIVPEFGVKPLSYVAALGIALIVGLLTRDTESANIKAEYKEKKTLLEAVLFAVMYPLMILTMGWLIKLIFS